MSQAAAAVAAGAAPPAAVVFLAGILASGFGVHSLRFRVDGLGFRI